jgi:hypothetical protein
MVAGTMRAAGCSPIDLWALVEGCWRLLNEGNDPLEILFWKISEYFHQCFKADGFLVVT